MARYPPQTRYAQSSGAKIAYQVSGTGPPDLVMVHGLVSHLDIQWQQTGYRRFVRALERGGRLIRMDKRGTGLSDPAAELPTTQERVRDAVVPCGRDDTTGQRRPADPARGHHRRSLAGGGRTDPGRFWLPDGAVELIAYAHSIDFGAKGCGNLVELAALQQHVAGQLGRPAGRLLMVVKSAHVYETERAYLLGVLAGHDGAP